MSQSYSQFKAFGAITKAAFRSIAKSPSSVVFTIAFPLIFILVFGFLGGGGVKAVKVTLAPGADTTNALYTTLQHIDRVKVLSPAPDKTLEQRLSKGEIDAVLDIRKTGGIPAYRIGIQTTTADADKAAQLGAVLERVALSQDADAARRISELIAVEKTTVQTLSCPGNWVFHYWPPVYSAPLSCFLTCASPWCLSVFLPHRCAVSLLSLLKAVPV